MPSTYSSRLRVELQGTGENDNLWGEKLNNALEQIDFAIAGVTTIATTGGTTVLSALNGLADESRAAVIRITGTLIGNATLEVPSVTKLYVVKNDTAGAFSVTIGVSGGTAVTVPQGARVAVYVNGTDTFLYAAGHASWLPSTATGNLIATTVQTALEELQGDIDVLNGAEADIASATTTAIGGVASQNVRITGTTTITSFGTIAAGTRRNVRMAGALTLTHNATSLILPGGANITTAAGDTFEALSLGSGNWFVSAFQRASGASPVPNGLTVEKFTSNGTFTPPAGVTTVWVTAQGGGGGGGAGSSDDVSYGGGGSSGVGTVRQAVTVTPLTGYAVTIGAGGAGGAAGGANNNGAAGGTTSLGALVSLAGGNGGRSQSATTGDGASAGAYSNPGMFGPSALGGAGMFGGAGRGSTAAPANSGGGGGGGNVPGAGAGGAGGSGFLIVEY